MHLSRVCCFGLSFCGGVARRVSSSEDTEEEEVESSSSVISHGSVGGTARGEQRPFRKVTGVEEYCMAGPGDEDDAGGAGMSSLY